MTWATPETPQPILEDDVLDDGLTELAVLSLAALVERAGGTLTVGGAELIRFAETDVQLTQTTAPDGSVTWRLEAAA